MDNTKSKVALNMYDLSQGMAKQFSPMFIGKQIDAIWHTGIVVYGKEYYFGGGICAGPPKTTVYGYPIEEIQLGETEIPQSVFEEFLRSIGGKYSMEKYDLFTNNCNNFTDECSQFLVGKNIPDKITGLPQEFLNTQLGQMLKPMIEQLTNRAANDAQSEHFNASNIPVAQNTGVNSPNFQFNPDQQQQIFSSLNQFVSSQQQAYPNNVQPAPPAQQTKPVENLETNVVPITDLETFICIIESSPKCIIDFYTDWCGPCKTIKPTFAKLSNENPDLQFYCINIDKQNDIAQQLKVTSIPTFITYEGGQLKERWSGGNAQTLIDKVNAMK